MCTKRSQRKHNRRKKDNAAVCHKAWFGVSVWWFTWWLDLGKASGQLYLLGKWVRLFKPFDSKASGFGGVPDSFTSNLAFPLPSGGEGVVSCKKFSQRRKVDDHFCQGWKRKSSGFVYMCFSSRILLRTKEWALRFIVDHLLVILVYL